jgi:hypothetical protein
MGPDPRTAPVQGRAGFSGSASSGSAFNIVQKDQFNGLSFIPSCRAESGGASGMVPQKTVQRGRFGTGPGQRKNKYAPVFGRGRQFRRC